GLRGREHRGLRAARRVPTDSRPDLALGPGPDRLRGPAGGPDRPFGRPGGVATGRPDVRPASAGARRLAAALAGRAGAPPPDRRPDRADGGAVRRPRHLAGEPGPRRRRAHPQARGPERGLLLPGVVRVRPRPPPLDDLPRTLPARGP